MIVIVVGVKAKSGDANPWGRAVSAKARSGGSRVPRNPLINFTRQKERRSQTTTRPHLTLPFFHLVSLRTPIPLLRLIVHYGVSTRDARGGRDWVLQVLPQPAREG